jgi:hypothetical protein
MAKVFAFLAVLSVTGCSWSHDFTFEDIGKIRLGETSLEEARRILKSGEREPGTFISSERACIPSEPWVWVSWPIFFAVRDSFYHLDLCADQNGILHFATLEIVGSGGGAFLLFGFGSGPSVSVHDLEELRRLQNGGVNVRIGLSGSLGGKTMSLDEYFGTDD